MILNPYSVPFGENIKGKTYFENHGYSASFPRGTRDLSSKKSSARIVTRPETINMEPREEVSWGIFLVGGHRYRDQLSAYIAVSSQYVVLHTGFSCIGQVWLALYLGTDRGSAKVENVDRTRLRHGDVKVDVEARNNVRETPRQESMT